MAISLGASSIADLRLGAGTVSAAYLGVTQVWPVGPPPLAVVGWWGLDWSVQDPGSPPLLRELIDQSVGGSDLDKGASSALSVNVNDASIGGHDSAYVAGGAGEELCDDNIDNTNLPISISLLAKFGSATPANNVLMFSNDNNNNFSLGMQTGTNRVRVLGDTLFFETSDNFLDTDWHRWIIIFNGASSELWVDGAQVATGTTDGSSLNGMAWGSENGNKQVGNTIAEMRLHNSALSPTEIATEDAYYVVKFNQ